jgi:hypothetical protein
LYISHEFNTDAHKWGCEKQDFESKDEGKDYIQELENINVKVSHIKCVGSPDLCLILQSDIFRWMWLKSEGGFYLDTDQIILKPFDTLPLDKEFIYCRYMEAQCGDYIPTGVLGLQRYSPIADTARKAACENYNPNNYNSSGPFSMRKAFANMDLSKSFNAPFQYFYPINSSKDVDKIYDGRVRLTDESLSLHWFGGHPLSQEFNKGYSEEFARSSKDTISVFCRENGIL